MRRVFFWASVTFLLFLGLSGLQSCISDWPLASSPVQRVCTMGQAVFGLSGVVAGLGAIFKWRWAPLFALIFAIAAGITAGLASIGWGESGMGGAIASGGLGLLLGMLLYLGVSGFRSGPEEH